MVDSFLTGSSATADSSNEIILDLRNDSPNDTRTFSSIGSLVTMNDVDGLIHSVLEASLRMFEGTDGYEINVQ